MGAVQQAWQTARAQAEAAGQFLTTVTESDESGSREVVVFDEAAFTQAWLAGSAGNAGLETLSRLYGMAGEPVGDRALRQSLDFRCRAREAESKLT